MLELIKKINEVNKDGEVKRYTNFVLRMDLNGKTIDIPIQPVNFGKENNRKYYSLLSFIAKDDKKSDEMPF